MTLYLLDANVLREFRPGGHVNVLTWRASVNDSDLRISAYTVFEIRRGRVAERERTRGKGKAFDEAERKLEMLARRTQ